MIKRFTYTQAKNICSNLGFEFLDSFYTNAHIKYKFKCLKHNHIQLAEFNQIRNGHGLKCCSTGKKKFDIHLVKESYLKKGYIFLDSQYNGNQYRHSIKCLRHNKIHKSSYGEIITKNRGLRCCGSEKIKHSIDYVRLECKKRNYEFLSNVYEISNIKYKFKCLKHNEIHEAQFRQLLQGSGLRCCANEKVSGINHPNWNQNLTEKERQNSGGAKNSTKEIVKNKYNYTCQICERQFKGKNQLNVHHIINYSSHKELKDDINNCFLFCAKHHRMFHSCYGKKNNNFKQIEEFKITCQDMIKLDRTQIGEVL